MKQITKWILGFALGVLPATAAWTIDERAEGDLPGRALEIRRDGQLVAALIYGDGQIKPYLAVYDSEERRLTNPGMESDGESRGRFPHHRGIFIGWNRVASDLGRDDLWHFRGDERMEVASVARRDGGEDSATLEVVIHWRSANRGDESEGLLLKENRRFVVSRDDGRTRIDQRSELTAARDLTLGGDLQHAGLHFRADAEVVGVGGETRYLWAPAELPAGNGRIVSDDLEWVNFRFPLHGQWYSVTQLNRPENRVTELSWRDYGRFGFFFSGELEAGESRVVAARFVIGEAPAPGADEAVRATADADAAAYLGTGE